MTYLDHRTVTSPSCAYLLWQIARALPRSHRVAVRSVGDRDAMQATFLDESQRTVDEILSPVPARATPLGDTWLREFDRETLRRSIALPGDRWGAFRIPDLIKSTNDDSDADKEPGPPILSEVSALPAGQCLILGIESLGGVVRALSEIWGRTGWEAAVSSTSDEAFHRLTLDMVRKQSAARVGIARAP